MRRPVLAALAVALAAVVGCTDTSSEGGPAPLDETTEAPAEEGGASDQATG